jgi:opacity protein-like surface antigen
VGLCLVAVTAATAEAQTSGFSFRGFADVGSTTFSAKKSFEAILGSATGPVFGGGIEMIERNVFLDIRASRFRKTGHRAFVFQGETFDLGIPATITVRPIELNAGYRFFAGRRIVPYAGIGAGWYKYTETSEFADASEDVDETFNGLQLLAGAEVRMWRWIAVGGEAQWARVPDALGTDPNGVASEFSEDDLGGSTFRFRIIIGR